MGEKLKSLRIGKSQLKNKLLIKEDNVTGLNNNEIELVSQLEDMLRDKNNSVQ